MPGFFSSGKVLSPSLQIGCSLPLFLARLLGRLLRLYSRMDEQIFYACTLVRVLCVREWVCECVCECVCVWVCKCVCGCGREYVSPPVIRAVVENPAASYKLQQELRERRRERKWEKDERSNLREMGRNRRSTFYERVRK